MLSIDRTQLDNSENLRIETQNTIDTLREEFDQLVKELAKYKKKDDSQLVTDLEHKEDTSNKSGGGSQLS